MHPLVFGIGVAGAVLAIAIGLVIVQAVVTFVLGNLGVILVVAFGAILLGVTLPALRFWH